MRMIVLALLAACGGSPAPAVSNAATPSVPVALPADADLGELGIMPLKVADNGNWLPAAAFPIVVEEALREGKGPPPSWKAIDRAGHETTLTYGDATKIRYGCDNNEMTVTKLDGDASTLTPGLLWLRTKVGAAKAIAIANGPASETKRSYTLGPVSLELTRKQLKSGVLQVKWRAAPVHAVPFERHDMDGADNERAMNLAEGDVGMPEPEAAWSFADDKAMLIVFRVPAFEGLAFKAVVVNETTGRDVDPMSLYLYSCAF